MDDFLMGMRKGRRLGPIEEARKGKITNREGAERAGLSVRQFRRLKQRVGVQGEAGLGHGNRGQPSKRRISAKVRARIVAWLQRTDVRVNDCHIAEKLKEVEHLEVSRETVRRVRRAEGIAPKRRRRPRVHRRRREREGRYGAMMLVDGSPFEWVAGAGEQDLVGAMDDATGQILSLVFRPHEDTHGYAMVMRETFTNHGLPERVYGDRTTVLVRSDDHWTIEEQLAGRQHPTHLGQALEDLTITYIAALSPQAKGRIERMWATLQDRLVVELSLRRVTTVAAATRYLPEFIADFNRRFAHDPREAEVAWRRAPRDLDLILSCRYERTVARDNTVTLQQRTVQVPPGPGGRSYAQCKVELRELLDGRLIVLYHGERIAEVSAPAAFELSPRNDRLRRFTPKTDAHRSTRIDDRSQTRTRTQAAPAQKTKSPRPRRLKTKHPWRRFSNPLPASEG
jgi:transposase